MDITTTLQADVAAAIKAEFGADIPAGEIVIQPTRPDFEGDFTVVTFSLSKPLRSAPPQIAEKLGTALTGRSDIVDSYSVVKGFLNLHLSDECWRRLLDQMISSEAWWQGDPTGEKVMVEFSSPNTNKPLHLGHVRNILLGWSISQILQEQGHEVIKVQVVNDRGIAICKSMLAWSLWADGATPESTGTKPDHFVGQWYVDFEKKFAEEYTKWQDTGDAKDLLADAPDDVGPADFFKRYKNTYFNTISPLGSQARELLLKWEDGDEETIALWRKMNGWVYAGFESTYGRMGVEFDKLYYESETYLLGKEMVQQGLDSGVFYRKEDNSVWVDLEDQGLDQKIVMRSDGTSVYLTQDLGTAQLRYEDFGTERMIYVVADEQNYHFDVLFASLKLLGAPYSDGLYHLSYGMVDLPTGRMKTREGTVVDADDLMDEVYQAVKEVVDERGELAPLPEEEREAILQQVSLAALKFFIIKVEPKKRMTFDPKESVDLQGQTGPYIQNAYVRIQSILRKAGEVPEPGNDYTLNQAERDLLASLNGFKAAIAQAAEQYNPGHVANYCYSLAKTFHKYYHDYRILNAETEDTRAIRLNLIEQISIVLRRGMHLLGIEMPSRM